MSFARNYRSQGGTTGEEYWPTLGRNDFKNFHNFNHRNNNNWNRSRTNSFAKNYNNFPNFQNYVGGYKEHADNSNYFKPDSAPSFKRRKFSDSTWGDGGRHYLPPNTYEFVSSTCNNYLPYARSNGAVWHRMLGGEASTHTQNGL